MMTEVQAPASSEPWQRFTPATAVAALIAIQLLVWTVVPYLIHTSMPLDVTADGVSWGHEWQLGYYKHPPLPGWLVEVFFNVFGDLGPFLLSQLAVGITYVLVYRLGCELLEPSKAAAGTILLAAVYYFAIPTPEWNHNVAQLPFWAAAVFWYWKAYTRGTLGTWAVFGAVAGLGMLTKYSTATLLAALFLHFVTSNQVRDRLRSPSIYVALGTFLLVVAPHVAWVAQHGFTTVHFFEARAGQAGDVIARVGVPVRFLAAQALAILPAVLVMALSGGIGRSIRDERLTTEGDRLLIFAGIGPALLSALFSLVTGLGLRDMWGLPMWTLTGLLLVRLAAARWQSVSVSRLYGGAGACGIIYLLCYLATSLVGPRLLGVPSRIGWPERAIAAETAAVWQQHTHAPLRIVTGESWMAGLVAMRPPRPSVFIDADIAKAPWITPERLRREGTLVVWQEALTPAISTPAAVLKLGRQAHWRGKLQFAWPFNPKMQPLTVAWAVIPPQP